MEQSFVIYFSKYIILNYVFIIECVVLGELQHDFKLCLCCTSSFRFCVSVVCVCECVILQLQRLNDKIERNCEHPRHKVSSVGQERCLG